MAFFVLVVHNILYGYLLEKRSTPFPKIVQIHEERGYTEPDPRDDPNGMDFARKMLIIACEADQALFIAFYCYLFEETCKRFKRSIVIIVFSIA